MKNYSPDCINTKHMPGICLDFVVWNVCLHLSHLNLNIQSLPSMSQRRFCSGLPLTPVPPNKRKELGYLLKMEIRDTFLLMNHIGINCLTLPGVTDCVRRSWRGGREYFAFCTGVQHWLCLLLPSHGCLFGVLYQVFLASKQHTQCRNCHSFFCKGQCCGLAPRAFCGSQ